MRRDQKLARRIRQRDGGVCVHCSSGHDLQVHHIDGDPRNNDPANLITLCQDCHVKAEAALREEKMARVRARRERKR